MIPSQQKPNVHLAALPLVDVLSLLGEQGECKYDPDLHTGPDAFEPETLLERQARIDAAKDICDSCPVWAACLEYALRTKQSDGVWAGHTARELAALRMASRSGSLGEAA
ncbi:WhiB family transcriptional regulator [Actinocorallia longicatena]|uniref:4Fe-4S Wbl-type domain-containing protein n=1 Tax=Actinocorallia longicatena TaxID=111803 RepID=A0ABP6Q9M9_9ACTN